MSEFVIIADSTADLDKNLRDKYNIDYVKMNYVVDGIEYTASLDWENHSASDFYNMMRNGKRNDRRGSRNKGRAPKSNTVASAPTREPKRDSDIPLYGKIT